MTTDIKPLGRALPIRILLILVSFYVGWFTYHSIDTWANMNNDWWDLGNIDSAAYNTAHGRFMFSSSRLYNYWSDHFAPILLVLSAYYLIDDGYWFIFFWQALSIGLAAVPLFLIAKHFLEDEWLALTVSAAYLANGYIHMGNLFDYHMLSHAGLFSLSAFYSMIKRRWGFYILFGTLLLLIKEDAPIVFFMFGFYAAFVMREYKWAAVTWIMAASYALFVFKIAIPYFRTTSINVVGDPSLYMYADNYDWMGKDADEVAENVRTKGGQMVQAVTSNEIRMDRWWTWITSYAFLPLVTPIGLLMLLPSSLEIFLNSRTTVSGLMYHYPLLIAPLWTLAFVLALPMAGRAMAFVHERVTFAVPGKVSSPARSLAALSAALYLPAIAYFLYAGPFVFEATGLKIKMGDLEKPLLIILALSLAHIALGGAANAPGAGKKAMYALALYLLAFNVLVTKNNVPLMLTDDSKMVYRHNSKIIYNGLFINPASFYSEEQRIHARKVRDGLKIIPRGASAVASQEAYHFISHGEKVYLYRGFSSFPFTNMDVEYAAIDLKGANKSIGPPLYSNRQAVADFLGNPEYGLLLEDDGFFIFRKGASKQTDYNWYLSRVMDYNAAELAGMVGELTYEGGRDGRAARAAFNGRTEEGNLVFGPYIPLGEGSYEAVFRIRIKNAVRDGHVVKIDVAGDLGRKIMAEKPLGAADFAVEGGWAEITLPFSIDEKGEEKAELRVHYLGGADVWVDGVRLVMPFETFLSSAVMPHRAFWSYKVDKKIY